MAKKDEKASGDSAAQKPEFSDADKSRARQWFKKATDCRERREYDYGIECYITGLTFWPDAVEEGHMPLRSLAVQRAGVGGKKPGVMDTFKKSMTGKDAKVAMLNAEHLLSMDPQNAGYVEGLVRNAIKGGFLETAKWAAPTLFESLKKDKKPNKARFKSFREMMVEAAEAADQRGEGPLETWFLEQAVHSLDYIAARTPGDEEIRNEQRDLAGKLTISRGKYAEAGDFRDSLRDAEKQKLLHDSERVRQGEQTLEALIGSAKREWEANPDVPAKINAYVDALRKAEQKPQEQVAMNVLMEAFERSRNYNYKLKADEILLTQLAREARAVLARAKETGRDEDRQQARLAVQEQRETVLRVYRDRVANYPTDLRMKARLGRALFEAGQFDEAIPVLQAAQADPRSRNESRLMLGAAFLEQGAPAQSVPILRETLDGYEFTDEFSKQLLYWLGRAYEADGDLPEARETYGRLLRLDYNYMEGDARKRLENLKENP